MRGKQKPYAIVLAAGLGTRLGEGVPKQYRLLAGMPVLRHSLLRVLEAQECFEKIAVVIAPGHEAFYRQVVDGLATDKLLPPIAGGATRQTSVYNALSALAQYEPDTILLHDAARPFALASLFKNAVAALEAAKGVICACPVSDTLKRAASGEVSETVARKDLYAAQTPQAFAYTTLRAAHEAAQKAGRTDFTDDAAMLEWQGETVRLVEGSIENFKLTTQEDWQRAEKRLSANTVRSALGFDVHRFAEGDHVMLGGVRIAHQRGVAAHSDGDVILHALTDALLGLTGEGDIGQHFPPSDPQWKNASSDLFVEKALGLLREHGGSLQHCDVTVIAEKPKLGAHRAAIRESLSKLTGLAASTIGLKATTAEGLGLIGKGEGLCAYVLVTANFKDRT